VSCAFSALVFAVLGCAGGDPEPMSDELEPAAAPAPPAPAAKPDRLPFEPPNGLAFMPVVSRRPNRPLYRTNCLARPTEGVGIGVTLDSCAEQLRDAIALIGRDPEVCGRIQGPWTCFTNREHHKLAIMKLREWDQLTKPLPIVADLRYRVEQWRTNPELREIVLGAHGDALVSDAVARDLMYEGLLTVALSRMPEAERTPELERAWAEGVHHLIVAVADPLVQGLREFQPQMVDDVTQMAEIASTEPLPGPVAAAVAAARAGEPLPAP
jgi:hypothetical protein